MKRFLYVVLLLLGFSILLSSCNKTNLSSIEGRWIIADYEYYDRNGSLIEKSKDTDDEVRSFPYFYFNLDGTGIIGGVLHFSYKIENNVITISCPNYEMDGWILKIVDNRLVLEGYGSYFSDGSVINVRYRIFYEKEK